MKKILKIILGIVIFIISFICVDGLCARFLDTRPLFAYEKDILRSVGNYDMVNDGVMYKSLFADIYYCNTIYEYYDEDGNELIKEDVSRYYVDKESDFVCPLWINERSEIMDDYRDEAVKYNNMEYMKLEAEGYYAAGYYKSNANFGSYNSKLGVYTYNFLGDSLYVSEEYQDIYMFDVNDFSKDPVRLEIDGFDLIWRTNSIHYSSSGNIMAFYYICGYRDEQWMGEQKYTESDCLVNDKENGIYVFGVNDINDYTFIKYYAEDRNEYINEYRDSYFGIYKILDDENIIIKYTVTHNKQLEPYMEVYYKWNIIDDTLTEWQV